jgi:septal ring factor EnvC (AmiA/AmiB activator)
MKKPKSSIKTGVSLSLFLILFLTGTAVSFAQTRAQLEKQRKELRREINSINTSLDRTEKRQKTVLTRVQDIEQKIEKTRQLIRVNNQQANLLSGKIDENQGKIDKLERNLQALKDEYAQMIRKSYKSRSSQNRIMFLFSSESFLQAYKRMQYMKQYAEYRKDQGSTIQKQKRELKSLNEKLMEQRSAKEKLVESNRRTRAKLQGDRVEQRKLVASIKENESEFKAQIQQKQREISKIDGQIQKIISEAVAENEEKNKSKASGSGSKFEMTPEAKKLSASFKSNRGNLPWPVESGRLVMRYGKHRHPTVRSATIQSRGVRIETDASTTVRAVFNGTVDKIQAIKGANKAVIVRHGAYFSVYYNLRKIYVQIGDKLSTKQKIGLVGESTATGRPTLYFYITKKSKFTNPASWITGM